VCVYVRVVCLRVHIKRHELFYSKTSNKCVNNKHLFPLHWRQLSLMAVVLIIARRCYTTINTKETLLGQIVKNS